VCASGSRYLFRFFPRKGPPCGIACVYAPAPLLGAARQSFRGDGVGWAEAKKKWKSTLVEISIALVRSSFARHRNPLARCDGIEPDTRSDRDRGEDTDRYVILKCTRGGVISVASLRAAWSRQRDKLVSLARLARTSYAEFLIIRIAPPAFAIRLWRESPRASRRRSSAARRSCRTRTKRGHASAPRHAAVTNGPQLRASANSRLPVTVTSDRGHGRGRAGTPKTRDE